MATRKQTEDEFRQRILRKVESLQANINNQMQDLKAEICQGPGSDTADPGKMLLELSIAEDSNKSVLAPSLASGPSPQPCPINSTDVLLHNKSEILDLVPPNKRTIAVMGFHAVGKTSLCIQYATGNLNQQETLPTIVKDLSKAVLYRGEHYILSLIDTFGQDELTIIPSNFIDIQAFVVVYSINSLRSFDIVKTIRKKIIQLTGKINTPIVLVGNKCDLEEERLVPTVVGRRLADDWNSIFIEVSAVRNEAVRSIFSTALAQIQKMIVQEHQELTMLNQPTAQSSLSSRFTLPNMNPPIASNPNRRNIAVLGYHSVGKTSLCVQYAHGDLNQKTSLPSTQEDLSKIIQVNGVDFKITLIDTVGLDEMTDIPSHYNDVQGYVVVYSINSLKSFDIVKNIRQKIIKFTSKIDTPIVLVANKCDLEEQRQVPAEIGRRLAASWNTAFIEVSATRNFAIEDIFDAILVATKRMVPNRLEDCSQFNITSNSASSYLPSKIAVPTKKETIGPPSTVWNRSVPNSAKPLHLSQTQAGPLGVSNMYPSLPAEDVDKDDAEANKECLNLSEELTTKTLTESHLSGDDASNLFGPLIHSSMRTVQKPMTSPKYDYAKWFVVKKFAQHDYSNQVQVNVNDDNTVMISIDEDRYKILRKMSDDLLLEIEMQCQDYIEKGIVEKNADTGLLTIVNKPGTESPISTLSFTGYSHIVAEVLRCCLGSKRCIGKTWKRTSGSKEGLEDCERCILDSLLEDLDIEKRLKEMTITYKGLYSQKDDVTSKTRSNSFRGIKGTENRHSQIIIVDMLP